MAVDEIKIRLTAFWVLFVALVVLLWGSPVVGAVLVVDFALRSFNLGKWSPLFRLSAATANVLHWQGKPVYLPAKRFAARIGFGLSILMLIFAYVSSPTAGVAA